MFPFRLTNRPCLMFFFLLLVLCSSSCYFWRQSFQCKVWLHHVHIHEQCMYPFQHKILNVLYVLPTAVHACSWLTAAVRLNIAFVLSYPQHLTTYYQLLPSQKNMYKTSERHVHNGDITPALPLLCKWLFNKNNPKQQTFALGLVIISFRT